MEISLLEFEDAEEDLSVGELLWDPSQATEEEVDQYLATTQCTPEQDVDVFYAPAEADLSSLPKLITQEQALHILHENNYDVEAATNVMKEVGVWSAKKRSFGSFSKFCLSRSHGLRTVVR